MHIDPTLHQAVLTLVTAVVGMAGAALRSYARTHFTPQRLSTVLELTRTAVAGAEKLGNAMGITSAEKYEYAESALTTLAKRVGYKLKPEEANAFIHAVLHEVDEAMKVDVPLAA